MTSGDKKIEKDYIRLASILNRAKKLYKAGSKVFDERYLKDNEERVMRENEFIGLSRGDIEEMLKVYDERDFAVMANNVYHQLCTLGGEWHDIRVLAKRVGAFPDSDDVAYVAETVLIKKRYIERDHETPKVRLTPLGRQNCSVGIKIPPSDIQRLSRSFTSRSFTSRSFT